MTNINNVKDSVKESVLKFLNISQTVKIVIEDTNKDFQGDLTVVVFPLLKFSKKSPEQTAKEIGDYILENELFFENYNVVKGFLNLTLKQKYWLEFFNNWKNDHDYGLNKNSSGELYMVEYSSPNTNKPLHLGHLRNIFLGDSVASILEAAGHDVVRTQIINDRGIHICKSMLAWIKNGNGETPKSTNMKGDHLVGKYYVAFDKLYKREVNELMETGISEKEAKTKAPILLEAQKMLIQWENGDPEVHSLWKKMNNWVYHGFEDTYKNLGVVFDKLYYESDTYHTGKKVVSNGLKNKVFYSKEDNSIWCNLSSEKMDDKLLTRSDGTSVYMTQDIGTAIQRFKDFPKLSGIIYTVGNEQNHHFKVLFKILEKLNFSWASNCLHLSYGMVELPQGKMKSREGTVVDADELLSSVISEAKSLTSERGFLEELNESEVHDICEKIGIAGLKYFLLKVDSKKKMSFDPKETIDLSGHTGPFIQYTFVRIKSLLKKVQIAKTDFKPEDIDLNVKELEVIKSISNFPKVILDSSKELSPYLLANFLYGLVKSYNAFYQDYPIISEKNISTRNFRIELSSLTSKIIERGMKLLGINMPNRM